MVGSRLDGFEQDAGIAEGEAAEDVIESVEHRLVGAPVDPQAEDAAVGAGEVEGLEIRREFGGSESIDGLLGVADEHRGDRGVAVEERRAEPRPLDLIGVLEVLDHDV